jgi:hypothetical protein
MINKKYNIEITVLSPLSIGAGAERDWVKGMDFVVKDGKAYLLNLKKMQHEGVNIESLTTHFADKNADAVLKLIAGKLDAVSDRIIDLPASSDNDIKSFIKNELSGKPIIPGSSLKVAVRSVILDYLLGNDATKKALFSIHELFNIINGHTYDYISKEIDFFNKYNQAEYTQKIINNLTAISNQIPDDDENCNFCILKMSAGSGFHSITGDWQYEDYAKTGVWNNGKQRYKSRKVAIHKDNFSLMGFVKLRVIN